MGWDIRPGPEAGFVSTDGDSLGLAAYLSQKRDMWRDMWNPLSVGHVHMEEESPQRGCQAQRQGTDQATQLQRA